MTHNDEAADDKVCGVRTAGGTIPIPMAGVWHVIDNDEMVSDLKATIK